MKTTMMGLIALSILLSGGPAAFSATSELKIATIDLKKAFDAYYKTKLADASIKDEASGLEKDLKALTEDHDKAVTEYKKAVDESSNQALSSEEREKRKKDAEGKLIKVNDLRQTIEQFNRNARNNLDEKLRLTRDKIVGEIKNVVNTRAKTMGYTMVLDTSTADGGRPSVVLYHTGDNDMTGAVIETLNANAPPDLPLVDDKKDKPKDKNEKNDGKKDPKK